MAQDELTAAHVSPTPPTNLLNVFGGTPPTTAGLAFTDDGAAGAQNAVVAASNGSTHEAAGAITTVTATSPNPSQYGQLTMLSTLGNYTATPNADHASGKAPASNATIASLAPAAPVSGAGTLTLTVTGTGFQPDSVVNIAGVPYQTQYNSATELRVFNAPKKATAGNLAITVTTGAYTTAATNWAFS
jgi:hypothetical protein